MLTAYVVLVVSTWRGHLIPCSRGPNTTGRSCSGHRSGLGRKRSVVARRGRHHLLRLPALYAFRVSGFYLALMIVLWLIIPARASIEYACT